MVRNWYPLPLIPELIAEVQDAFVFTKFDVEGGFNKVRIKDRDQQGGLQNEIWPI